MPRNTREWAHRELKYSRKNLEWALYHLNQVRVTYNTPHPEIAEPIENVMDAINMLQEAIEQIEGAF